MGLKKAFICTLFFASSCGLKKSDRSESATTLNQNYNEEDVISSSPKGKLNFQSEVKNVIESNHVDVQSLSDVEDEESKNTLSLILFLDD